MELVRFAATATLGLTGLCIVLKTMLESFSRL